MNSGMGQYSIKEIKLRHMEEIVMKSNLCGKLGPLSVHCWIGLSSHQARYFALPI